MIAGIILLAAGFVTVAAVATHSFIALASVVIAKILHLFEPLAPAKSEIQANFLAFSYFFQVIHN